MDKPILHKHIIVRAECMEPPRECDKAVAWWEQLVKDIGMVKLDLPQNPICGYVDTPGNEGLTICGIIETSHIAMHVWDATRRVHLLNLRLTKSSQCITRIFSSKN